MNIIGGSCPKCYAPYYVPSVWHGIFPPQPQPTCVCWNLPKQISTQNIKIDNAEAYKGIDPSAIAEQAAAKEREEILEMIEANIVFKATPADDFERGFDMGVELAITIIQQRGKVEGK